MKVTPELLPLIEWWEKDGKQTVIYLAIAAVAVGGWYGFKNHRNAVRMAARDSLVNAYTAEEIETACVKFSSTPTAGALKLRLAKKYYDDGKYEEAMSAYDELMSKPVEGFEDIPVVGKAQCLEALGKHAEAQKAFDAFAEKNPKSYLLLTAQLGSARSLAQAGDKKGALAKLEALKKDAKENSLEKARIESTISAVERLGKKAAPASVEKPAETKAAETKAAAKPAEAKAAAVKPAETKKAAETKAAAKPAETKAAAKPAETKAAAKPAEAKAAAVKPAEVKPAAAKPAEAKK